MNVFRSVMVLAVLALAAVAEAQTPNARFVITMEATTAASCSAYRFDVEIDAVIQPTVAHVCSTMPGNPTAQEVRIPIPAVVPGDHVARFRAVDIASPPFSPIFGPFSDPFTFTMKATPSKPTGVRIEPIPGGF